MEPRPSLEQYSNGICLCEDYILISTLDYVRILGTTTIHN
jgi:hypothetical protein